MSDVNQETIADVVAEVRRVAYNVAVADANTLNGWRPALCLSMLSDRIEASHKREVDELRECLKEAIREKCPFTRMSCKHGEPCEYECGTFKWRMALQDEGCAK